jgi:hypothetical protein
VVQAQVEFSSCPVKDGKIIFSWSAPGESASISQLLASSTSSTLLIPANTLIAGRTYNFVCTVYKDDAPSKKNSGTYRVTTLMSPLKVVISGGNRVASVQSNVVLDASASLDPDFVGSSVDLDLQFMWQCNMVRGRDSSSCRGVNGMLLNLSNSRVLRFPPDLLAAQTLYKFTLDVSKGSRFASESTYVQIDEGSFIDDAKLVLASQARVDANEKISIVCNSSTVITSYKYVITEVGATAPTSFPLGRYRLVKVT